MAAARPRSSPVIKRSSDSEKAAPSSHFCAQHDVLMKFFCFSCKAPVCSDCILDSHADHPYEYVSVAARMFRDSIGERSDSLREVKTQLELAATLIDERKAEIVRQSDQAASRITGAFDDLTTLVRRRGDELTWTLDELTESKLKVISDQKTALRSAVCGLNNFLDAFSTVFMLPLNDYLAVVTHDTLLAEALYHRDKCSKLTLEPSEVPNICVSLPNIEDIRNACASQSDVYLAEAFGPGLGRAELGQRTCFSILPLAPVLQNPSVHVTMTSLADGTDVKVVISEAANGGLEVVYRPAARGWHRLCVEVGGAPARGSPFSVLVTLPPTRFKRAVRKVGGVSHSHGITFTHRGKMVVAEYCANRVTIRDRNSSETVELEGHQFCHPWGVAVDNDDNIYVSEEGAHCISKFTCDGQYVKSTGTLGSHIGELHGPRGLHVIGSRLYVAERNNNRVQVFNTADLRPLKVLVSRMPSLTTGVAASPHGHLFVSGTGSPSVHVFSVEHCTFLHSIEHTELQQPSGLCYDIHQDLLYVADPGSGCVFAFNSDGTFVARFCDAVAETGLLLPWSVAVDGDGFVYVCDTSNCQIFVY